MCFKFTLWLWNWLSKEQLAQWLDDVPGWRQFSVVSNLLFDPLEWVVVHTTGHIRGVAGSSDVCDTRWGDSWGQGWDKALNADVITSLASKYNRSLWCLQLLSVCGSYLDFSAISRCVEFYVQLRRRIHTLVCSVSKAFNVWVNYLIMSQQQNKLG